MRRNNALTERCMLISAAWMCAVNARMKAFEEALVPASSLKTSFLQVSGPQKCNYGNGWSCDIPLSMKLISCCASLFIKVSPILAASADDQFRLKPWFLPFVGPLTKICPLKLLCSSMVSAQLCVPRGEKVFRPPSPIPAWLFLWTPFDWFETLLHPSVHVCDWNVCDLSGVSSQWPLERL